MPSWSLWAEHPKSSTLNDRRHLDSIVQIQTPILSHRLLWDITSSILSKSTCGIGMCILDLGVLFHQEKWETFPEVPKMPSQPSWQLSFQVPANSVSNSSVHLGVKSASLKPKLSIERALKNIAVNWRIKEIWKCSTWVLLLSPSSLHFLTGRAEAQQMPAKPCRFPACTSAPWLRRRTQMMSVRVNLFKQWSQTWTWEQA